MFLNEMFSDDFQKAMKRVARGTQKGSTAEHPTAVSTVSNKGVNGKGKYPGNYDPNAFQPKKDKVVKEADS